MNAILYRVNLVFYLVNSAQCYNTFLYLGLYSISDQHSGITRPRPTYC